MKKLKLKYPLLVEGSYDKNRVSAVAEGTVITCGGFGIFNSAETKAILRRITQTGKLLVLTDSDGAGLLIRGKLKSILNAENIINIYTPQIQGKEKRKRFPSKAGFLGVEGMSDEVLYALLLPFSDESAAVDFAPVTAATLYAMGLVGGEGSTERRNALCVRAGLPTGMNAKAFREAINALGGDEFLKTLTEEKAE